MQITSVIFVLICVSISAALRATNHESGVVFDIFVESNDISDTATAGEEELDVDNAEDGPPPPHEETAKMARYICHKCDWGAMATIAAREPILGFPFANVFSLSDGVEGESSGVPYLYTTPLEMSVHDLKSNPQASITMSLAQTNYCTQKHYDPEDPRCAHVILTGTVVKIPTDSPEGEFAARALFTRHPIMPDWPKDHGWFFAKLNITNVLLLDFFGGAANIPVEDYFKANVE